MKFTVASVQGTTRVMQLGSGELILQALSTYCSQDWITISSRKLGLPGNDRLY